jgi:hypothetical protein
MNKVPISRLGRYHRHSGLLSHENTFGNSLSFPPTLGRTPQYIQDQQNTDYCTAFARAAAASYLLGKQVSTEYQTAKEGELNKSPIYNGTTPNIADGVGPNYGHLPDEQSPLHFATDGWIKPAVWQNYPPTLDGQAIVNAQGQPFDVNPDYVSIKSALLQGQADNAVVVANGFWYSEWNANLMGIVPFPRSSPITRHSYLFIDWKTIGATEYLVAQLSQGTSFGDGGVLYMSEAAVNAAFANPILNGIGCEITRKGTGATPVQLEISAFQKAIQYLGEILTQLGAKI